EELDAVHGEGGVERGDDAGAEQGGFGAGGEGAGAAGLGVVGAGGGDGEAAESEVGHRAGDGAEVGFVAGAEGDDDETVEVGAAAIVGAPVFRAEALGRRGGGGGVRATVGESVVRRGGVRGA